MSKFGVAKAGWGKATELYKAWKRNKASKKLFKEASGGMQYPVIKSVKPKLTKGESTKVWGQKLRGKFKKTSAEIEENLNKVLTRTNKLLQKVKGEKITESGFSKAKDIKK